jgi:hypothetical protein
VVLWRARREVTKVLKKGHSEEKILRTLHQAEGGQKVVDICRKHRISSSAAGSERLAGRRGPAGRLIAWLKAQLNRHQ